MAIQHCHINLRDKSIIYMIMCLILFSYKFTLKFVKLTYDITNLMVNLYIEKIKIKKKID